MIVRHPGSLARSSVAAASPSMPGISMSNGATSGLASRAAEDGDPGASADVEVEAVDGADRAETLGDAVEADSGGRGVGMVGAPLGSAALIGIWCGREAAAGSARRHEVEMTFVTKCVREPEAHRLAEVWIKNAGFRRF